MVRFAFALVEAFQFAPNHMISEYVRFLCSGPLVRESAAEVALHPRSGESLPPRSSIRMLRGDDFRGDSILRQPGLADAYHQLAAHAAPATKRIRRIGHKP